MLYIKISDFIARFISSLGVKEVFLISGGSNVHIIDSISKNPNLRYVCNHHEQASSIAAESYSRISGNIGVCITTVGPAATNTITGVASAWLDSIPVLYISGQVKRDNMAVNHKLRQLGVQEINIIEIVKSITKYATVISDPYDVKYHLEKAVYLAKIERPGPVYLDIPSDVQGALVEEKRLRRFDPQKENLLPFKNYQLKDQIKQVINLLQKARRPIIFAGHGIRLAKARQEFLALVSVLNVPVTTTMSAHDLINTDHPLYAGRPGVFGDRSGNFAIQNADMLLSIGARHHLWNIGYNYQAFAREAKKIVVDIDDAELKKKTVIPDLAIRTDAKEFINELIKASKNVKYPDISSWIKKCQEWREKYPVVLPEYKKERNYVNSYYFTDILSSYLDEREIIVTGVGTSFTGTQQSIRLKKEQQYNYNVGCASMGYDLPAAVGACFANKKRQIVLITGEGSMMMNLQELQTISHYRLPIKIFLLNNNCYLAIKNTQNSFFGGRFAAADPKSGISFPDFRKIATAFQIAYLKMKNHPQMARVIKKVLSFKGPIICDINMSPDQTLYPKVYSIKNPDGTMVSKPLEDMFPFLPRKEFLSNIIIKPYLD